MAFYSDRLIFHLFFIINTQKAAENKKHDKNSA